MVDFSKIPTVNNFLHFFSLITGNIVVGWIHFVLSFLIVIAFFIFLVFNESTHAEIGSIKVDTEDVEPEGLSGTVLIIFCLIILVVSVFMAFISFWFIRGIKTCDPSKMKPYLIFSAIFVILSFLTTLFTLQFFLLVITVFEFYFLLCSYSLYRNFVNQSCGIADVVYQNPGAYGYSQAYEEDYNEGSDNYQQQGGQQGYGNFDSSQQGYYGTEASQQQVQPQQGQYYGQ